LYKGDTSRTDVADWSHLGLDPLKGRFDPEKLLAAAPRNFSPHLPNGPPVAAYQVLKSDFSSLLPNDQELDISRTYLVRLGATRFGTMRGFRTDIAKYTLDGSKEPTSFTKTLWWYPVRQDIAAESELQHLFLLPPRSDQL
jgi:hypothetical protein